LVTPALRLSQITWRGTPPKKAKAAVWAAIQSGSPWLSVAMAKV